jgi:hypothetical protein
MGIMILTPQIEDVKYARTLMYGKRNNGTANESLERIADDFRKKSCSDLFYDRLTRLSIDIRNGKINLYNTSPHSLNENCLTSVLVILTLGNYNEY